MNKINYKVIALIALIIIGTYSVPSPYGCDTNNNSPIKNNQLGLKDQSDEDTTWTLLGSSIFETWDTPPLYYSHISLTKEKQLKIRITDDAFINTQQTLTSNTKIEVVGSIEHAILVKQYDASDVLTSYASYHFDFTDLTATDLIRTPIPVKYNTWTFQTMVQLDDSTGYLYWIMTDSGNTYLVQIDIGVGTDGDDFLIDSSLLDIKIGSSETLFDETSKDLYTVGSPMYGAITIGEDIGVISLLQNIRYHKMYSHGFAIQSRKADQSQFALIYLWHPYQGTLTLQADIFLDGLSGDPTKLYTENQYNFVISRTDKAKWINVDFEGASVICAFGECMETADAELAYSDFYNAKQVNFQKVDAFILYTDKIMIYNFDLTTPAIVKTTEIAVSAAFSVALEADKSVTILAQITCLCSSKKLVRFNCFSASFNCIATNWFQSTDCSVDIANTPPAPPTP